MDGTSFIVPDWRPQQPAGIGQRSARDTVCRLALCAAVVLAPLSLLVSFAVFGTAVPVLEICPGP